MTFDPIDYIADDLYRTALKGKPGPRWWCLRSEIRTQYRALANERINGWLAAEKGAMEWAEKFDRRSAGSASAP